MKIQKHWLKRLLALALVIVSLVQWIPAQAIAAVIDGAKPSTSFIPGDVNGDNAINAKDVNLTRRHIAGGYNVTINTYAADVNADGAVNAKDINLIRRHIAGGYGVELKRSVFYISFYDGDRLIDTLTALNGQPLGEVPSIEKSSKADAILMGYFTDPECTKPFYAENPVTGDMKVYAKYQKMGAQETLNFTSYAQMDQKPDLSFTVIGTGDPAKAVTLEVMDGSDPVELAFTPTSGGYTVYAPAGFNEGCSYQLHLADGWKFKGKPDTIRTASFSIAMKEVENLQMNDDIIYIKDTAEISYTVGGKRYEELTTDLVTEDGGSFNYNGSSLTVGDTVCIYVGKHPNDRDNGSDTLLPVVYMKVTAANADTVKFVQLTAEEQLDLYEVPDNFPILVPALPTEANGSANIGTLDADMYVTMMGEGYDLNKAKSVIGVGDFVTLYVSQDDIASEADLYYGQITGYDAATGAITYTKVDRQTILDSMDLYSKVDLESADYISAEEKAAIEAAVLQDVSQSGFAEDAAFILADMITKTDAFRSTRGIQDLIVTDDQGNALTPDEIEMLNIGGSFELTDDVELTVELITNKAQLRYGSGVRIAVGVEAEFEVELESEDKININLSATFVEEVALDPRVKGSLVYKEILWIPVPVGVSVGATVDIRNFTAFSFEAEILTIPADDPDLFTQFTDIVKNPEKLADFPGLPDELSEGLKTVGDVFDKIEELQDEVSKAVGTAEETSDQILGYAEDIADLWEFLETNNLGDKETYNNLCGQLGKTSITSDLLGMLNLEPLEEGELNTEYYESLEALMERYCEMLEQETDWITLVEAEMGKVEACIYGICIGVEFTFLVHADMSLAIGSNLEYEVGKRYEFWFKIGLFKPTAGSTTMDLLDEHFAFQFYIMGRLGLRVGVKALVYVGIGTGDVAQVGITVELGPYMKMYGFFIYEYEKHRPANTSNWIANERMAGSLFMEFGLYVIMGFEASAAADLFSYSCDFFDIEIPLVSVGDEKYHYQPNYAPEEGEIVLVKDVDGASDNGITMTLPDYTLVLKYLHMTAGYLALDYMDYKDFIFTVSNPNFSINPTTGEISVNVPKDTRYMECDLTATYKYGKLSFSTYDMSVTVPLVWTNLSTEELSEYYTAAVRVGNAEDGYVTVWSKRVLKNKEFNLPTTEEVKELIGWNDYKHIMGTGYNGQKTEGLTLIENEVYDFDIDYKTYSITVSGVQKADGSTESKTFYAGYGEAFDFSALESTGTTNYANGVFTKFAGLNAPDTVNLNKAIDTRMADALKNGVKVSADYVDNSVSATFTFTGIDAEDVTVKLRRGDVPNLAAVEAAASNLGMAIVEIFPAVGVMNGSGTYQVVCGELKTEPATITFQENGGGNVADITKPYGSLIGNLPTPERAGHTFDGWFADEALTEPFALTKVPKEGATAYAKWTASEYTVTFHVNGGNELENKTMKITYGVAYGELPKPERTGYGFIGWFTAAEGGEAVTAKSQYALTADQTIYAQWRLLEEIPETVFDFGEAEQYTYEKDTKREVLYTFNLAEGETYAQGDFTFKYMRQGDSEYVDAPINAGTYNVTISRPADDYYAKFEKTYTAVVQIAKAVRPEGTVMVELIDNGYTWIQLGLVNNDTTVDGGIYDLNDKSVITYKTGSWTSAPGDDTIRDITRTTAALAVQVTVVDPNYEDWTSTSYTDDSLRLKANPTDAWTDEGNYDISWYEADPNAEMFTISTPAQLAGFAKLSGSGNADGFKDKTVMLGADVDMRGHSWTPIRSFKGIFDGQGHTISGVYYSGSSDNVGLFGDLSGDVTWEANGFVVHYIVVKNLVLDDAYISGKAYVGGIAGSLLNAVVDNCASYAQVRGSGDAVGGIVGHLSTGYVVNCVNYGRVSGSGRFVGGIVGLGEDNQGDILNNANFGSVYAGEKGRVGGIAGLTNGSGYEVQNNYNCGTVSANDPNYIGSIVGRNESDDGKVKYNYYLYRCAVYDGRVRNALGSDYTIFNKGATVDDGGDYPASSFSNPTSGMKSSAGKYAGKALVDALNEWVEENGGNYSLFKLANWVAEKQDSYPMPIAIPVSALRK